jgi:hypothetical protein
LLRFQFLNLAAKLIQVTLQFVEFVVIHWFPAARPRPRRNLVGGAGCRARFSRS